ncbi:MAG: alpha/beta hydrolase fold domain-containing protein [Haloarculaceae archaeon]
MHEHSDLQYAERESGALALDLYVPNRESAAPLVVSIHGGGWQSGDRTHTGDTLRLVDRGYAIASVSYRLTDAATFPAQVRDCRAAVRWLRAHAGEYGLDSDRVAAWGWSAGAHLAALLGTAPGADFGGPDVHPDESHRVDAVVDFFGPTDLLAMGDQESDLDHAAADSPEGKLVGGPVPERADRARRASPLTHVDGTEPPFLVVHGSADRVVPREQSDLLVSALADADVPVTYHVVAGGGHGGFDDPGVPALVDGFLDRHVR